MAMLGLELPPISRLLSTYSLSQPQLEHPFPTLIKHSLMPLQISSVSAGEEGKGSYLGVLLIRPGLLGHSPICLAT